MCQVGRYDEAIDEIVRLRADGDIDEESFDYMRFRVLMGREDSKGVTELAAKYPDDPAMQAGAAVGYAAEGENQKALEMSEEAVRKIPATAIYHARVLDILGKQEEAANWYERARFMRRDHDAEGYLADLFEKMGDIAEAENMLRAYLTAQPFLTEGNAQQLLRYEETLGRGAESERARKLLERISSHSTHG